jgi:hypothetical protein
VIRKTPVQHHLMLPLLGVALVDELPTGRRRPDPDCAAREGHVWVV